MDSRRTDSTESAAKKMTSFNASTPPVASAVATTACAVLGVTGAILHQMTFSSAQLWSIAACMGAYVAGGYVGAKTWHPSPCRLAAGHCGT